MTEGDQNLGVIIQRAEENLQRQIDWIERHDTRAAFVGGVAIAMLGVIASLNWATVVSFCFLSFTFGASIILLFLSLLFIYFSQYPTTDSPNSSLLFFGTISSHRFEDFKKKFKALSDEGYLDDVLCQAHINAQIVQKKFHSLKWALILLLVAVIPWAITIYRVNQLLNK